MARKSRKTAANAAPQQPKAKTWKCAVYARLSCKNNGREDEGSLRAQIAYIQDSLADRPDLEIVNVFADNGKTGTTFEGRVEFDALMDEVRSGAVDCIAVKDLSRFGRNMYETSTYLERIFPFLGVRFIAVNDGLDTLQGDGGIVVPFKGLVNELFSVDTSRKVGAIKQRQMEEGLAAYRHSCYGYRVLRDERRLEADDETAPFIPLVFSMYLDGERLKDIAEALEEMGAPTPFEHLEDQMGTEHASQWRETPWTPRYVAKILDNPVYVGTLVLGKTHRSLSDDMPVHVVPEEDRYVFEEAHPALVSQEVFGRVQEKRRRQKANLRDSVAALEDKRNRMPDDFKDMLFCAECGGHMTLDRRFNPKTGEARGSIYRCRKHHGRGCGNDVRIPERVVRIAVMDAIRMQISTAVEFEKVLPGLRGEDSLTRERKRLAAKVDDLAAEAGKIARKRQRFYECYAEGVLLLEDYKELQRKSDAEAADCQRKLDVAHGELADFDKMLERDNGFDEAVAALEDLFTFSRELLVALVNRVEVSRDGSLDVEFRFEDWIAKARSVEGRLS